MFGYSGGAVDGAAHRMLNCSVWQAELCKEYVFANKREMERHLTSGGQGMGRWQCKGRYVKMGAVDRWLHQYQWQLLRVMAVALLAALSVVPPC